LLRVSLPGLGFGADAFPAEPGEPGRVKVWLFFHNADDIWLFPALPGAPALPTPGPQPQEQFKHASVPTHLNRVATDDRDVVGLSPYTGAKQ
jgi:hypothetical protein